MSQICSIESCKRASCALCHCCQQNICLSHLKEHQDSLVSELNPLIDQINALGDRLNTFSLENMTATARKKLEQWRVECHQKIDHFFKEKCHELDLLVTGKSDKHREEICQIQSKVTELIREQHATRHDLDLLILRIRNLEQGIDKIEQISFNIRSETLKIDDSWIIIKESYGHQIDLSNLLPVYKTEHFAKNSPVVISNGHFLLTQRKPNLCFVNRHLEEVKHIVWNDGDIYDICWSSVLDRFIVIDKTNAFFIDERKLSVEKISAVPEDMWYCCTCSNRSLYLSINRFGSSIIKYSLLPSIKLMKHWKSPYSCQKNEAINHMKYSNGTLALLITKSRTETVHIELRTSKTLQRLWLLQLNIENIQRTGFCCCPINNNEWLVTDHTNTRLIHVTGNGRIKAICAYNPAPLYSCMFGYDILAVVTGESINFHKL